MKIGKIIKKLRGDMTQNELSKRAGLDFTTISKIEKGSLTGTLTTHQKIAKALGISLSELYHELEEPSLNKWEISSARKRGADVFYYDDKALSSILVKQLAGHKMVPELLRLEKGGQTHKEERNRGSQQFIYVLEGKIEAVLQDASHPLNKGECIYFDAALPHLIKNISPQTAKCLRVTCPADW